MNVRRFLTFQLLVQLALISLGGNAWAQPQVIEIPMSEDYSLKPHGIDLVIKVVKKDDTKIIFQVIDHSRKEDRVFEDRNGGTYTKSVSASKTLTASYDQTIPGTINRVAFLFEGSGIKVYALNAIAGMNKTKIAFVK